MRIRLSIVLAALPLCISAWGQAPASKYKIQTKYPAPGDGRWDYITFDEHSRRILMSHGNEAVVVSVDGGKLIGVIPDTPGIHGAMIAGTTGKGYTTNGTENKVSMFDAKTLKVLGKIDVGKGPDAIYYHEGTKRVFTTNHGSHDVTALDATTGKGLATINVKGDGEATVTAKDGMMYLNLEDTAEVV